MTKEKISKSELIWTFATVFICLLWIFLIAYFLITNKSDEWNKVTTTNNNMTTTEVTNVEDAQWLVNKKWAEKKDVLLVFSKDDEEANNSLNDLVLVPNQILWIEDKVLWIINEDNSWFAELWEKLWVIDWTPLIAIKSNKYEDIINKYLETNKENIWWDEWMKSMKEQIDTLFEEKEWYRVFRLWEYSIWWKNSCAEDDWLEDENCSKVVYLYDERCQEQSCDTLSNLQTLKNSSSKKTFFKEVEIKSEEWQAIKEFVQSVLPEQFNLPLAILYKINWEQNKNNIQLIAEANNEIWNIEENKYLIVPNFMENDWKEWDKVCTLDESLFNENPNEYQSCALDVCKDKYECIKEEHNVADIFVMWYCPYCKDHVKRLKEIKEKMKDTKFTVRYLVQYDWSKNTNELTLADFQSLHWEEELNENVRQICIDREYWDEKLYEYFVERFWDTYNPDNYESNLVDVLAKVWISEDTLNQCRTNNEKEIVNKLLEDVKMSVKYWVQWTPTWLINNKYVEQWSAEDIELMICWYNENLPYCQIQS